MSERFRVVRSEASYWWRTNVPLGTVLHRLMLLFIFVPAALVMYDHLVLSLVVFGGMIPYGFLLQQLAEKSVFHFIEAHPEAIEGFEADGIIVRDDPNGGIAWN